jgi:tRNA(Ile)-lysidine synthase
MPQLTLGNMEIRRFEDELYVLTPLKAFDATAIIAWDTQTPCEIPGIGRLVAREITTGQGLWLPPDAVVTVRFRRGGESIQLAGRGGSRLLKKLWQEWRVPPWLRDRIPLLCINGELVVVVGYALAAGFQREVDCSKKERIVEVDFEPPS